MTTQSNHSNAKAEATSTTANTLGRESGPWVDEHLDSIRRYVNTVSRSGQTPTKHLGPDASGAKDEEPAG